MTQIEKIFSGRAIRVHSLVLYDQITALAFVNASQKAQVPLLGLDAFLLDRGSIRPMMEHSLDFSSSSFSENLFEAALRVIQQSPADTYFEFTCP